MIVGLIGLFVMSFLIQRELQIETHPGVKMWINRAMWMLVFAMLFQSKVIIGLAIVCIAVALLLRVRLPESYYDKEDM